MRISLVLVAAGCGVASARPPSHSERNVPRLVGPGVISTGDDECHISPDVDGKTFYFLKDTPAFDFYTIVSTERRGDGNWSRPEVVPFSGKWVDADFTVSADGRHAYFVSQRPVTPDGEPRTDTEIWTVDRDDHGRWGEPRHVDELGSPGDEWFPTLTNDGTIYFGSSRPGGLGGVDIYRAQRVGDRFAAPENLGAPVNSAADEVEPFIAPDESYLIMSTIGHPDSLGAYELYLVRRGTTGWGTPEHLPAPLNSTGWDFGPRMSRDGKQFYFSSNRRRLELELPRRENYDDLERRLHSPGNGLRDIYVVDAAALGLGNGH